MNRVFVLIATGAVWAFMMSELVKRELLPYLEYKAAPSYRNLVENRKEPLLQRWVILLDQKPVGSSEALTEPLPNGFARVRSKTSYEIGGEAISKMLGSELRLEAATETMIDASYQLSTFTMTIRSAAFQGRVDAKRRGAFLDVTAEAPPLIARETKTLPFEEDMTLMSTETPFVGSNRLYVGKKWEIHTVALDLREKLKKTKLYAVVESREDYIWRNRRVQVFRVDVRRSPTTDSVLEYQMFVDDPTDANEPGRRPGRVLEQRTTAQPGRELRFILEEEKTLTADEAKEWKP